MADLAIGLSTKVVNGLVKKVDEAVKEEQQLWQIVERDSVFIKDEFAMMTSFLKTADRDRVRNSVVRTWVRQVRDLSYDAEDIVDGVLELEPKRPWWALPFLPRVLPTCCRPKHGRALDEAVDKIKLIKSRVEEVSQRNLRYNLINTTGSGQIQQAATAMDLYLDLAKMQEGSWRLRNLLAYEASQDRLNVVSVWGTGGNLGTISIIRDAFHNPNVCRFYKYRAWVKLMHPFSPQKFLGDLVAQLLTTSGATSDDDDVLSKMEASSVDLAKEVKKLVKGCSYLIVLEGLSNMVEWDTIRTYLPDDENRSRVIVSTQHREIARLCIGQPQYVHELSQLSEDDRVYAFFEEPRIPSEQNQGSTGVASLSATANYWYYLVPSIGSDEDVRLLSDRISASERRPPNDARVVTVLLGAPDNGKDAAAVVAKVCSQLLLSTESFELYGWVYVPNPFDVLVFSQYLLSVLRPKSPYSTDPVGECLVFLRMHRCLVVINGLQRTQDCSALERAGLIDKDSNSCIVVVTTEESVDKFWTITKEEEEEETPAAVCNDIEPIAHEESLSGQQQDKLLQPIADSFLSTATTSSKLKDFADYWYNHCLSGRDEELHQLYHMISSSSGGYHQNIIDRTRVLTVWGCPPGVEKNTLTGLVAKVYSHYVLTDPPPFQLYGWVDMSSSSNPDEITLEGFFSQSLLEYMQPQLTVAVPHFGTDDTTDTIQGFLINLLANNRCLVVIDGLKSVDDCQKLLNARLIYGHPNSCIILITEEQSVATFWKQASSPYAVCNVKPPKLQRQGQLPTPRNMLDPITSLFYTANWWFPKFSTIIGRDDEVNRLSTMISNGTRVIVIWGPPGVGKTALVEKVYSQFVLNGSATRPFGLCGWVQVFNPFNLMGFSRSLLSVLRPQSPQSPDPARDCSNLVRNHACLVVIDGLQSMENLLELAINGFIYGHPNSCIVLITTQKSVVTSMAPLVPKDAMFQVKPLDLGSAMALFKQVYDPSLIFYWRDNEFVMKKCCGLPIVIFAVAKYLRLSSEDQVTQFTAAVKDGRFIRELATNTQLEFVGLKGLLAWVDAELKACSESLKLLILYMLTFPQEKRVVVRRKRVVWRWIAEGYIKNTGICDMVTEAEERFRELEDLIMMMVMQVKPRSGGGGWHRSYEISGFCGEVLKSRAAEDPLFLPLEVSALTYGKRSLTSRGCAGRHLRIDDCWDRNEFVFRSLDLSRLRSLTVSGRFEAYFINDSMKVLRVLDLEDVDLYSIQSDALNEIPKLLPRLRFLSLRRCRGIDRLPESIGDLRLLQTLDIRSTGITTLPDSILKLRKLQCLRAGDTMKARPEGDPYVPWSSRLRGLASCSWQTRRNYATQGVTMPRGMSQLTALHTLGIVNVNTVGGQATLQELRDLEQLRKLELYGINSYNVWGLWHLQHLDPLSLGFTKDRDNATSSRFKEVLFCLGTNSRLKLHGHVQDILQVLPGDHHPQVTDLTLEIDRPLTGDDMKHMGKLRWLRSLCLHFNTRQGDNKLKFDANDGFPQLDGFPRLEVLQISTSFDGETPLHVEFVGAVQKLEVLNFAGSLKISPRGLHVLPSLKQVLVDGAGLHLEMDEILEGHPNKPVVSEIIIY